MATSREGKALEDAIADQARIDQARIDQVKADARANLDRKQNQRDEAAEAARLREAAGEE